MGSDGISYGCKALQVPDPGKNGELLEVDTRDKKDLFKAISGQLEIVGLSTANDEHLFMMINNNPNIRSVVYCKRSIVDA